MQTLDQGAGAAVQTSLPLAFPLFKEDGTSNLRTIRQQQFGLNMREFAEMLGVPFETYKGWEVKNRKPTGSAASLLRIALCRPDVLREVLGNDHGNLIPLREDEDVKQT